VSFTELIVQSGLKVGVVMAVVLTAVAYLVWAERKVSSWMQDRVGPNRVGPAGLLQPIADAVKLLFKEDIIPANAYRPFYLLAPVLALVAALSAFAVIPFSTGFEVFGRQVGAWIADLNIGILYILAVGSLNVYGLMLAGWASGSKYSLLGGLRASAQVVSYELALGFSIIGVLMVAGSFRLSDIAAQQAGGFWAWNAFTQPLAFLVFFVAGFAETNRLPFDMPEAEPELVAGYHTEYSSMKFSMFFMAEYTHMITISALTTLLFLGGWHLPFLDLTTLGWSATTVAVVHLGVFTAKLAFMLFVFIWVRWTLPRFRYDQLMSLGWKTLLPIALINIAYVGIGIALGLPWLGGFVS
jgi:NADH-quinone oxidoreductase subunit H